jgi:histone-lysine N-methyltransferase SETMAR
MALCTISSIMTSGIGKCSRWVPRQLADDHKHAWQTICQEDLEHHAPEGNAFLQQIVTEDESWVYHYEPESKRQSMHGSTCRLRPTKNSRHRFPLGKSC